MFTLIYFAIVVYALIAIMFVSSLTVIAIWFIKIMLKEKHEFDDFSNEVDSRMEESRQKQSEMAKEFDIAKKEFGSFDKD